MYREATAETLVAPSAPLSTTLRQRILPCSSLVVTSGPARGQQLKISKPQVTIGRSGICDLILNDPTVSGTHFEIITTEAGFMLRDLGAKNGTRLNDLQVREVWLESGTRILAGNSELRFDVAEQTMSIELSSRERFCDLLGSSVPMREVFAILERVAVSDLTVVIQGETGTGKELAARAIHDASRRAKGPFVVQDCSTIPKNLVESTLLGHAKGAFTGANEQHVGCFEQANQGTLFLDEIGDLDLAIQPKLLRVLETKELRRVGDHTSVPVNVRVVAATNRDLRALVNRGHFREDLYFRLCSMVVTLPPLRDRGDDIALLTLALLRQLEKEHRGLSRHGKARVSEDAMHRLQAYHWPGNVRELKNTLERAISIADGPELCIQDLLPPSQRSPVLSLGAESIQRLIAEGLNFKQAKNRLLETFEATYLRILIDRYSGNITRSAQAAGLTRYHLRELVKRHGIRN
jgi:DNA-binding NtrC family response regulator